MAKMSEDSRFKKAVTAQVLQMLRDAITIDDAIDSILYSFEHSYAFKARDIFNQALTAKEDEKWYCGICMRFYPIDHFTVAQRRNIFAKKYAYCPECVTKMNGTKPSAVARKREKEKLEMAIDVLVAEEDIDTEKLVIEEEEIEVMEQNEEDFDTIIASLTRYKEKVASKKFSFIEIVMQRDDERLDMFLGQSQLDWTVLVTRRFAVLTCIAENKLNYGMEYIKDCVIKIEIGEI